MWPHDGQPSRSRSSPSIGPKRQLRSAARAVVEHLGHPRRDAAARRDRRRAARPGPRPKASSSSPAVVAAGRRASRRRRSREQGRERGARSAATSPMTLAPTQARRNRPFVRSTGIHAQADRQIRTRASAVVTTRSGAATRTHSLISGLPSGTPSSRAVMAIAPRTRTGTESRTKCFWSGVGSVSGTDRGGRPWRLGGRVERPGRRRVRRMRRSRAALPVEDRHARLPALVFHRVECTTGRRPGA